MENINLNPQLQNPNVVPPPVSPNNGSNPPAGAVIGKHGHWALVVVVLVLLVGFFVAWMYVKEMDLNYGSTQLKPMTQEELDMAGDAKINEDIQVADIGNLDVEFQAVDNELNSL